MRRGGVFNIRGEDYRFSFNPRTAPHRARRWGRGGGEEGPPARNSLRDPFYQVHNLIAFLFIGEGS